MGIWGSGNFERDDALNTLDYLIEHIVEDIRKCFMYEHNTSLYEDHGEAYIVANIDILITLIEHYKLTPYFDPDELAKWKSDYLDTYDRTITVYYDMDHPEAQASIRKRRQVIAATFDRFYDLIKKVNED